KEALEQQTATAEVLQVISSSVADTQPVFDKILDSCARLFNVDATIINLVGDDGLLRLGAIHAHPTATDKPGWSQAEMQARIDLMRAQFPIPLAGSGTDLVTKARRVLTFPDIVNGPGVPSTVRAFAMRVGFHAALMAPMLSGDKGIGSMTLMRRALGPFSAKEEGLLKTFADQAVIAIQNARLFNETKEALEQQTATAEVLQVISSSVADTQPVFDKILDSCERLFAATALGIYLVDDAGMLHIGGSRGASFAPSGVIREVAGAFPRPISGTSIEIALRERRVVHFPDVLGDPGAPPPLRRIAAATGNLSVAFAPMLWEGRGVGAIQVSRDPPSPFSEKELNLLKTFADQAVIAIQNARLFNETREALEQQKASSEVLNVISSSVEDTQPVFDSILRSCERLFGGTHVVIDRLGDDRAWHLAAYAGPRREEIARLYPTPLGDAPGIDAEIMRRHVTHFPDVAGAKDVPENVRRGCELIGCTALAMAPMLTESRRIGTIIVGRNGEPFTAKEVALLQTFADQAVIAIQNSSLFNETREALEQQTATSEVLQVISSSVADTQPVFEKILDSCRRLFATEQLGIFLVGDDGLLHIGAFRGSLVVGLKDTFPRPLDESLTSIGFRQRRPVYIADALSASNSPPASRELAERAGNHSVINAPMLWEDRGVGSIAVLRQPPRPFSDKEIALLKTFADQAVIAIQNARLFNEIQTKSRELEMANKHKSEFLANMSHELRTPLNAIIGFSEVLSEQMFGEVNEKQLEYLRDIHSSGHHLLSLINDILDISKIEAGRMELDLATTSLPMLLDNCTTLVRERASRNGLVVALDVEDGIGDWVADVRKLKQVVINLLANAVKFTPAGGRVTLRATRLEHAVEIAVVDTGVGIAKDQQALVFEEFRQAGGDYLRKSEGTGLGLSLARRFVELHGGSIRVESEPGRGATFAFILPERVVEAVS
ncbi:MAG TPA: GAF domain-containing protein, partial [Caldimonas sp.]